MKLDAPFYVGDVNLFDYQARTGFKRWNTLVAARLSEAARAQPSDTVRGMLAERHAKAQARRFHVTPITNFGAL
jgi:hypothetical protein